MFDDAQKIRITIDILAFRLQLFKLLLNYPEIDERLL